MSEISEYKLVIIGAGPAGLTASIYASRFKIPHVIISPTVGGAGLEAHQVENWPGEKQIKGSDLVNKFWEHAKSYNPEYWAMSADKINKTEEGFEVITSGGKIAKTKAIIFCGGTQHRRLAIPGEKELLGRGVSYCATCDAAFFKDKKVAVIGGANSALMACVELDQHAKEIYLIYRSPELKGEPVWVDRIKANKKITLLPETNVTKIAGENKVEKLELDKEFSGQKEIPIDGLFIEIGVTPLCDLVKDANAELDANGSVKIDANGATTVAGIYAAGDTTNGMGGFRQIITATAEGAVAARGVFNYLKEKSLI